jgi:hypothetical protein
LTEQKHCNGYIRVLEQKTTRGMRSGTSTG